jgi:hypothetical protein
MGNRDPRDMAKVVIIPLNIPQVQLKILISTLAPEMLIQGVVQRQAHTTIAEWKVQEITHTNRKTSISKK